MTEEIKIEKVRLIDRMKETMMSPGTHSPLSLVRAAVYAVAVLVVLVSSVLAEMPVEQTWNEEHRELLGQINRLKKSKKKWRDRLTAEGLGQERPQGVFRRGDHTLLRRQGRTRSARRTCPHPGEETTEGLG